MKTDILFPTLRMVLLLAILPLSNLPLSAQRDSDSVHLSTRFLEELDNAFGFPNERPQAASINTIRPVPLDSELLHLWVKDPRAEGIATVSKIPMSVSIPGLTDGGFAKGIVAWRPKKDPDLMLLNTGNGYVVSGIDIKALLSAYLTKEGRTLRKSRALAASCKEVMDRFFPISGNAIFSKDDSLALVNKNQKK